jgi:exopolysaccharide production protein ExoY
VRKRYTDFAVNAAWPLGGLRKRAFDLTAAGLALIVLAPLMLATAVLVRLAFGKRVIDIQECIGFSGRPFPCYSFCTTMTTQQQPWAEAVGVALRTASLDRLPQLLNVLRGDMSVVGPQPILAAYVVRHHLRAPEIFKARPGLISMWHNGRGNRIALDRYYVRHWSIGLDGALLFRAIVASLRADAGHLADPSSAMQSASKHGIT